MKFALFAILLLLSGCSKAYTLRLELDNGICSGTAVGKYVILTAAHCFETSRLVRVNGEKVNALEIIRDGKDHALVRIDKPFKRWAIVGKPLAQGEHITMIGNPAGVPDMYREGYVMQGGKETLIQIAGFMGDSGAGLFDRYGRLRGVLSGIRSVVSSNGWPFGAVVAYRLEFTPKDWADIQE